MALFRPLSRFYGGPWHCDLLQHAELLVVMSTLCHTIKPLTNNNDFCDQVGVISTVTASDGDEPGPNSRLKFSVTDTANYDVDAASGTLSLKVLTFISYSPYFSSVKSRDVPY